MMTHCELLRAYFPLLLGPNQQDAGRFQDDLARLVEVNARLKSENQALQQRCGGIRTANANAADLPQEVESLRMALDQMQKATSKSIGHCLGNPHPAVNNHGLLMLQEAGAGHGTQPLSQEVANKAVLTGN
jgi:uncharacterized protein YukE